MALTLAECREKLQPWILAHIDKEMSRWIWNDQFTDILNTVARDLNSEASIHRERFYRQTTAGETNYELDRDIIGLPLLFKIEQDNYYDQYYTIVQTAGTPFVSTVVLKLDPGAGIQMDFHYMGQTANVTEITDEIDLPDPVLYDYLELVKAKIRDDYSDTPPNYYQVMLESIGRKAKTKVKHLPIVSGSMAGWLELNSSDDHYYDITDNYVGMENVVLNGDTGKYEWID